MGELLYMIQKPKIGKNTDCQNIYPLNILSVKDLGVRNELFFILGTYIYLFQTITN
jgi:hypothetical protein